jgi:hypothetical protein
LYLSGVLDVPLKVHVRPYAWAFVPC